MSSDPFIEANVSCIDFEDLTYLTRFVGAIVCSGRFTTTSVFGSAAMESNNSFRNGSLTTTGNTEIIQFIILVDICRKLLTTTRKP